MVLGLVHNDNPPKALQWHPLVDVPKVGEVVSQHAQDQGIKKRLWERRNHHSVRGLRLSWRRQFGLSRDESNGHGVVGLKELVLRLNGNFFGGRILRNIGCAPPEPPFLAFLHS